MPECIVDECQNRQRSSGSFGWCNKHYKRWKRHGDTNSMTPTRGMTLEEKFQHYSAVAKTEAGCVEWAGPKTGKGYGLVSGVAAHRLAWELDNGLIPKDMCILHHCDNPSCINPDHLYAGTPLDNARDRVERGRSNHPVGEKSGGKLTEDDVRSIRHTSDGRHGEQTELARIYGVSRTTIRDIINNRTWKANRND